MTETNTKIIPLTYDFMFKALFGNPKNIKILTRFLSDYFNIEYSALEGRVKILNNELIKNNKNEKKKSVDIIVELDDNEIINIEMNANNNYPGLIERNTAYICKIFEEQYTKNDDYKETKKCIQINFNTFSITEEKRKRVIYQLIDNEKHELLTEKLEIHHIDIEYINKMCYNENEKLEKWVKILKSKNKMELKRRSDFMEDIGKRLVEEVERLSEDEHIIGLYDGEKHARMVQNSIINYEVEKRVKETMEKMEAILVKKGMIKGVEQGIEQNKKETVINMLEDNMDYDLITKYTGVDRETILEIKTSLN